MQIPIFASPTTKPHFFFSHHATSYAILPVTQQARGFLEPHLLPSLSHQPPRTTPSTPRPLCVVTPSKHATSPTSTNPPPFPSFQLYSLSTRLATMAQAPQPMFINIPPPATSQDQSSELPYVQNPASYITLSSKSLTTLIYIVIPLRAQPHLSLLSPLLPSKTVSAAISHPARAAVATSTIRQQLASRLSVPIASPASPVSNEYQPSEHPLNDRTALLPSPRKPLRPPRPASRPTSPPRTT